MRYTPNLLLVGLFLVVLWPSDSAHADVSSAKDRLKGMMIIDVSEAGGETVDYGYAYNSRRRMFPGGACLEFSSTEDVVQEAGSATWEGNLKHTTSLSDIAKESNLSVAASASYKGPGASVSVSRGVDIVSQTKTHRFSQTLFAWAKRIQPLEYLDLESVSVGLKPKFREMLETPGRRGEFRQACGDGFVIGMRWGHRFYGIATMTDFSREFAQNKDRNFEMAGSYGSTEAGVNVNNVDQFRQNVEESSLSVKVWKTGDSGFLPTNLDELQEAYSRYSDGEFPDDDPGERLELVITSYETLNDFPVESPLAERTHERKLGYMKDALWDLQSMIAETRFYLEPKNFGDLESPSQYPRFAFGSTPRARRINRRNVESLRDHWKSEFEALRKMTLRCMEDFSRSGCEETAQQYWRSKGNHGPRIRQWREELTLLPQPYAAICRNESITITSGKLNQWLTLKVRQDFPRAPEYPSDPILVVTEQYDPIPGTPKVEGDLGWGGGRPVLARGWLNFTTDSSRKELMVNLGLHLSEYSKDSDGARKNYTEVGGFVQATVFPTNPMSGGANTKPRFPDSCLIDGDYPAGRKGLVKLRGPDREQRSKRLHADLPPGADHSLMTRDPLAEALSITNRAYGYVRKLVAKNRKWETHSLSEVYPGNGILQQLQCVVRTDGPELPRTGGNRLKKAGAYCTSLTMNSVNINFYPQEDDSADEAEVSDFEQPRVVTLVAQDLLIDTVDVTKHIDINLQSGEEDDESSKDSASKESTEKAKDPAINTTIATEIDPGLLTQKSGGKSDGNDRTCRNAVQGKIAWNYSGSKQWAANNVKKLCKGAEDSNQPARCFQKVMHGGVDWGGGTRWQWGNAINLCAGTRNASRTIECFEKRIADGQGWRKAIQRCASD